MGKYRFPKVNHKVNKLIREMNKSIETDPLWKGRFEVRQISKQVEKYYDNSGYAFYWLYRVYDKKTGIAAQKWFDYFDLLGAGYGWKMGEFVNDFIVNVVKVWQEEPRPSYDSPSYIGKNIPEIKDEDLKWV